MVLLPVACDIARAVSRAFSRGDRNRLRHRNPAARHRWATPTAGGFEGVLRGRVRLHSQDTTVPQRRNVREGHRHVKPSVLRLSGLSKDRNYPVAFGIVDMRALDRLLPQPDGFEGRKPIHIALEANDPSTTNRKDNCRFEFQLDSAASTAPEFVQEHNDVVARVNELLCLQAPLFPRVQILFLERLDELGKAAGYAALSEPAD